MTIPIILLLKIYQNKKSNRKYQIIESSQKIQNIQSIINKREYRVPKNTLKSQNTQKFNLTKEQYQYADDEFNHFPYYTLKQDGNKKAAIVTIILGGTPWSACIRRITQKLYEMKYDIYILPNPGSMEPIDKRCKCDVKEMILSRNMYNLIKDINKNKQYEFIDLVGYSLGSFIVDQLVRNQKYKDILDQIGSILYGFVELEPMKQQQLLPKLRRSLGQGWTDFCINNKEYLVTQGIPEERINKAIKAHTVEGFYGNVIVPHFEFKTLEEWYEFNNVGRHSANYQIPTLFVFANDDYICKKFNQLQRDYMMQNQKYVDYAVVNYGNHVGCCLQNGSDVVCEIFQLWREQK